MQHCCSETLLQECATGDSHADSTHEARQPLASSSCSMQVVGSVLCAVVLTSNLTCTLPPRASASGRDGAGHRPSRWPSHSQRLLCCWWSPGEAVLLCTFGEGSWALPQARRRRRWRCLKEVFCGEVRQFCFLCPPGAAWCAWPPC